MFNLFWFLFTIYLVIEAKEEIQNENRLAIGDCSPSYLKYKPEKNKYYLLICPHSHAFHNQSKQCIDYHMIDECQYEIADRFINYELTGEARDFCERNQIESGFASSDCRKDFVFCKHMRTLEVECPVGLFLDRGINVCQEGRPASLCGTKNNEEKEPKVETDYRIIYLIILLVLSCIAFTFNIFMLHFDKI